MLHIKDILWHDMIISHSCIHSVQCIMPKGQCVASELYYTGGVHVALLFNTVMSFMPDSKFSLSVGSGHFQCYTCTFHQESAQKCLISFSHSAKNIAACLEEDFHQWPEDEIQSVTVTAALHVRWHSWISEIDMAQTVSGWIASMLVKATCYKTGHRCHNSEV